MKRWRCSIYVIRLENSIDKIMCSTHEEAEEVIPKSSCPHFRGSQTSTANRRRCMKPSLRVKIIIIFCQSNFHLHYDFFVNPASTCTYHKLFILFHQSK